MTLKVGAKVQVEPFEAGYFLGKEHAAFNANNWEGVIIEYHDWGRKRNHWWVQSGDQNAWFAEDELTVLP